MDSKEPEEHSLVKNQHRTVNGGQKKIVLCAWWSKGKRGKQGFSKRNGGFWKSGFRTYKPEKGASNDFNRLMNAPRPGPAGPAGHIDCASRPTPFRSALRVDAQAGDGTVGIGGWRPYHDEGQQRKDLSPWLAVRLTAEDSPWAFRTDGESHRVIFGLEASAVLMGLKFLLPPHVNGDPRKHLVVAPVLTDNQGNCHALSKLHSCRFPLAAVIMEMSEELKARAMTAEVQWAPGETNEEADASSNLQFAGFRVECRVAVSIPDIRWHIFDQALQWAQNSRSNREHHGPLRRCLKRKRHKKLGERLRLRDLW